MSKSIPAISRGAMACLFILAGLNHFLFPRFYASIMPPYLPCHEALIAISGAAEIAGGIGVLIPKSRRLAGWGLILLLVAVFPANVHAAMNGVGGAWFPSWILWSRLPLQGLLIAWVYWGSNARSSGYRIRNQD